LIDRSAARWRDRRHPRRRGRSKRVAFGQTTPPQGGDIEEAAAKAHVEPHALEQARADLGVLTSRANTGSTLSVQWSLPGWARCRALLLSTVMHNRCDGCGQAGADLGPMCRDRGMRSGFMASKRQMLKLNAVAVMRLPAAIIPANLAARAQSVEG
jgi:hypothetical protein